MSARISGVKNFESKAVSLFRGLLLSQVQSQSEKGSIFFFTSSGDGAGTDCVTARLAPDGVGTLGAGRTSAAFIAAGDEDATAFVGAGAVADATPVSAATRLLSSAFSSSISACMAASCRATAGEISGSAATVARGLADFPEASPVPAVAL